jgi:hypothetical protein
MNAFARQALTIHTSATAAPAMTSEAICNRETADDYSAVLFTGEGGRFRIIACQDALQWIVQLRRPLSSSSIHPWKAIGYCCSKLGLLRVTRHRRIVPEGLCEFLTSLPERFPRLR